MRFLELFDSPVLSKKFFALMGGLLLTSGSLPAISYPLPTPIGGPVQLNPALTYPDPVLANLDTVMDNFFQPPYYPGNFSSPTYLENIYYLSGVSLAANLMFSPYHDNVVQLSIGQNLIVDLGSQFLPIFATNTFATSQDGGSTWSYGVSCEQPIPLGGTISQLINASIGPGLYYEYSKDGSLHATGWGFVDLVSNPPHLDPLNGFLTSVSNDEGLSWAPFQQLWPTTAVQQLIGPFGNGRYFNRGPGGTRTFLQEFYTTIDPSDSQIIHASSKLWAFSTSGAPGASYLSVYYYRSDDGGKTFSAPVEVYSIVDDEKTMARFFNADYGLDLEYLKTGGTTFSLGHPVVYNDNTILLPVALLGMPQGISAPINNNNFTNLSVSAYGVIRSFDGGKTWSKNVNFTEEHPSFASLIYDPGFVSPSLPVIIEGHPSLGYFLENDILASRSMLGQRLLVSPATGRIYLSRPGQRVFKDVFLPPNVSANKPQNIVVSSSSDGGSTWSHNAEISRTPKDIFIGAQQNFAMGTAISEDGWFVVSYYDFRNWTGYPGEIHDNIDPETAPPLTTDAWLAVYRETEDPLGGSTGAGLDFVGEIRLTPESFNSRDINLGTAVPYLTPFITAVPEGTLLGFNNKNELFVVYSTQSPGSSTHIDTNSYKGMTVDTNAYQNLFLQRFKFPKAGNQ